MRLHNKKFIFWLFLALFLFTLPTTVEAKKRSRRGYSVSARSAIFSNITQVKRYYGKNVHTRVVPASTTKVMTALLVLERLPLDAEVKISSRVPNAQPSKINLRPGERYAVRDLLYAILLNSANDASIALAEAVAGSESNFVALMNQRARQLGAKNTRFVNSNGLPVKGVSQYTSAYDMMLMLKQALKHDFFRGAITLKYKKIYSSAGRPILLRSHNKILFSNWKRKIYGKTGYTRSAKQCFIGYIPKGNDICIIGVFGCTRRWSDIRYIVSRYGGIAL